MENNLEKIGSILIENNYKITSQRKMIINIILENQSMHLNSEEIYDKVKLLDKNIGLATVYRSLKLFCGLGILNELNFGDGSIRYDLSISGDGHNHHHLICSKCGKILEVKDDLLNEVELEIERTHKFKIENHNCKFTGICEDCI